MIACQEMARDHFFCRWATLFHNRQGLDTAVCLEVVSEFQSGFDLKLFMAED